MKNQVLTAENAIQILNSRKKVTEVGKNYVLKVTSVTRYFQPEDGDPRHIVNLNGMTSYHIGEAKKALKEGDFDASTNFNISASRRPGIDYTPQKGQLVNVVMEEYENKEGIKALGVASITALDTAVSSNIDFSNFLEEEEETAAPAKEEKAIV